MIMGYHLTRLCCEIRSLSKEEQAMTMTTMTCVELKEYIRHINETSPTMTSEEFDQQNEELFRFVNNHSNEGR